MRWTVGTKIGTGFGLPLAILITIKRGLLSDPTNKLVETGYWVTHTHEVLESFRESSGSLTNVETNQAAGIC